MSSVSYAQAQQLSRCTVVDPRFDSLVTDQVLDRLPIRPPGTECQKLSMITAAGIPTLSYIASGGALNAQPVAWQAKTDLATKRIGALFQIAGDIKDNLSQLRSVLDLQAGYMRAVIRQKVGEQMWTLTPGAESPTNMATFAAENPAGMINAAATIVDLGLLGSMRAKVSPWTSQSPLYYVMHSATFAALEESARAMGFQIPYYRDELTGRVAPYVGSFEVLLCDWISRAETTGPDTTSVYLIRIGKDKSVGKGIEGLSIVGDSDIKVGAFAPSSGTTDLWQCEISWTLAVDAASRSSVVRSHSVLAT
jgi:hypothetical protein